MSYWWVNQGQTYDEERAGGYLWAPKRSQSGSRLAHWEAMTDVAQDDLIVHYVGKPIMAVRSLSVALERARDEPQPASLQRTGLWSDEGRLVPVVHVEDVTPVPRDVAIARGPHEAPFTQSGSVKQGYLWPLTLEFGHELVELLDPESRRPEGTRGPSAIPIAPPEERMGRTVPLEAGRELRYEQVITPARRTAVRREWSLVDRLVAYLGVDATRREYRLEDGTTLWSDLWIEEGQTIVEAKASPGRGAIREAIGQLYDYAHKEDEPVRKVLLVPARPADDLLGVLDTADITAIWPLGDGWCAAADDPATWRGSSR